MSGVTISLRVYSRVTLRSATRLPPRYISLIFVKFAFYQCIHRVKVRILLLLAGSFLSCSTYQSITKREEITEVFLREKLVPGEKYIIKLKSGTEIYLAVNKVDSTNVYGVGVTKSNKTFTEEHEFIDSFKNLHMNVSEVSLNKINTVLSLVALMFPIGVFLYLGFNLDWL
jgi:hypothetical protein